MRFKEAVSLLSECGIEDARLEAAIIFEEIGGFSKSDLVLSDPETNDRDVISAVERRQKREPLAYIIGHTYFYNERYKVTPDCLIPRSDTEILVEYAVKNLPRGTRFADLCTGSGCIAVSTLKATENTTCVAVDISEPALDIARENAESNGVGERITFLHSDATHPIPTDGIFAILSNPPYVTREEYESLDKEIYFEPSLAFIGEEEGLYFYKRITEIYKDIIPKEGFIAYEIGYMQADALRKIAERSDMDIEIIKDYGGRDRVAVLRPKK